MRNSVENLGEKKIKQTYFSFFKFLKNRSGYKIEGKSKLLIFSKMELKHINPNGKIDLKRKLNHVEFFFLKIVKIESKLNYIQN